MKKRFVISLFAVLCSIGTALPQERINEFVVNIDETHNPMTIYSSYGATPNDGVVIVNSTIPNLEFNIPAAPGRIRTVPDKKKNRYVLIIQPNDSNYKQYTITINAKGFKQGKIESVVIKAGLSTGFIVNPKKYTNGLPLGTIGGHEYVDLGLPSGTLWATCNVGAVKPEDCGDYYSWGETWKKSTYNKDNYRYIKGGNNHKLTKYCTDKKYGYRGFTDFVTTLEACDDAATTKWGEGWHTPTINQWEELISNCFWTWTSDCIKIVGSNGNSILLPVAGSRIDGDLNCVGSMGDYWSSSLYEELPDRACSLTVYELYFPEGKAKRYERNRAYRFVGFPIRPVCSFQE